MLSDHQSIGTRFASAMNKMDRDAIRSLVTDDFVTDWPQSGERIEGLDNFFACLENYPRRDGALPNNDNTNVSTHPAGAVTPIAPTYVLVAVEGGGNSGTFTLRVTYPDGSRWWAVNLYRLREGRIHYTKTFFAPEYPAPEWRGQWVVPIPKTSVV